MQLSKTDYINFLKHPAWMWLKKHEKALMADLESGSNPYIKAGKIFESFVEKNYPEGVTIGFNNYDEYLTMPHRTQTALSDPIVTTIFQSRFEKDSLTCVPDIVIKVRDNVVDLFEIKASSKVEPKHQYDLAFQKHVIELCGLRVENCKIILVNTNYVRLGEIDPEQLIVIEDVTNAVSLLKEETITNIDKALQTLHQSSCPDKNPSQLQFESLKNWMNIYRHFVTLPDDSIYNLNRLTVKQLQEFELEHISLITDLSDDQHLRKEQQVQVKVTKEDRILIDHDSISMFLDQLQFPLYFLDYETASSVIPPFDRTKPHQQVPFQFSLHILETPESELKHVGYLHSENSNPVEPLSKTLQSSIGEKGTVLVWYEGFEKERNNEMGKMYPEFENFYQTLNGRVVDLMLPFSCGWYADRRFFGSASIKKVLPVIVPELSYQSLKIQEGGTAQTTWMETFLEGKNQDHKEQILQDLDHYCTLDTLAMVKIYQFLIGLKQ